MKKLRSLFAFGFLLSALAFSGCSTTSPVAGDNAWPSLGWEDSTISLMPVTNHVEEIIWREP